MSIYVVGNWKMNLTPTAAIDLVQGLARHNAVSDELVNVVICPPFTLLSMINDHDIRSISLGGQTCHHVEKGAYTGEISAQMLRDVGCTYVILGHSERRRDQHEDDALIGRKALHAHHVGLRPIVCVGETLDQRHDGSTFDVVKHQLDGIIASASSDVVASSLIAYEPVWAIGTGLAATAEQAQEVHAFIRSHLHASGISSQVPLLYGGSVTSGNAAELFACVDIDGALVGGASLKADEFAQIIHHARSVAA